MSLTLPAITVRRDETHRYWCASGRELLGVTAILKTAGLIDDRWFTEDGTLRGSYAHLALQYLDDGNLVESSVDPALQGYLDAYRQFLTDVSVGPVRLSETMLAHHMLGFAGTVDRVRDVRGRLAVIDFKTGAPQPWHRVQLAAYAVLVATALQAPIVRRYGLYLRPDGTYTFIPYTDRSDWDVFKAALTVASFQRAHA